MSNIKVFILAVIINSCFSTSAWGYQAKDDLAPFLASEGDYTVDPDSGGHCIEGYTDLTLSIDVAAKTVIQEFFGPGMVHGQPTAGVRRTTVGKASRTEVPSFPGRKFRRTIVKGRTVRLQESSFSPLAFEFGRWKNVFLGELIHFEDSDTVTISNAGFKCRFRKN